MAITASDPSPGTGYKTMTAATLQAPTVGINPIDLSGLSDDLVRDIAAKKGVLDTVYITKTDTIIKQVTKVKWRQATAPDPVVVRDTIREAHYYLATQVGTKEGPTGECIPIYEVRKVDEVCPQDSNSSVMRTPQYDNGVGD